MTIREFAKELWGAPFHLKAGLVMAAGSILVHAAIMAGLVLLAIRLIG